MVCYNQDYKLLRIYRFNMCFAIPGKVIEISKDKFVIEYPGENRIVNISVIDDLIVGDYVIVNNKVIIAKVLEKNVEKFFKLLEG